MLADCVVNEEKWEKVSFDVRVLETSRNLARAPE
jgi:hypothetical protein